MTNSSTYAKDFSADNSAAKPIVRAVISSVTWLERTRKLNAQEPTFHSVRSCFDGKIDKIDCLYLADDRGE